MKASKGLATYSHTIGLFAERFAHLHTHARMHAREKSLENLTPGGRAVDDGKRRELLKRAEGGIKFRGRLLPLKITQNALRHMSLNGSGLIAV
jgi:hypothetical protein